MQRWLKPTSSDAPSQDLASWSLAHNAEAAALETLAAQSELAASHSQHPHPTELSPMASGERSARRRKSSRGGGARGSPRGSTKGRGSPRTGRDSVSPMGGAEQAAATREMRAAAERQRREEQQRERAKEEEERARKLERTRRKLQVRAQENKEKVRLPARLALPPF